MTTCVPTASMLTAGHTAQLRWPRADPRCLHVVGIRQETVTAVHRKRDGFEFVVTRDGDGTVPLSMAVLPGSQAWYCGRETRRAAEQRPRDLRGRRPVAHRLDAASADGDARAATRSACRRAHDQRGRAAPRRAAEGALAGPVARRAAPAARAGRVSRVPRRSRAGEPARRRDGTGRRNVARAGDPPEPAQHRRCRRARARAGRASATSIPPGRRPRSMRGSAARCASSRCVACSPASLARSSCCRRPRPTCAPSSCCSSVSGSSTRSTRMR